jgi:hypothetical protein
MTPEEAARLFAENRRRLDQIIAKLAWRAELSPEQVDAFRTWAIERLADDSYLLVRRFGEAEFSTYLTVTLSLWLREFRGQSSSAVADVPRAARRPIVGFLAADVSCLGAVVGTARFDSADGLAYASFVPGPGYEMIGAAARDVGGWLSGTHFCPSDSGDFASGLAALWSAPHLSLVDTVGRDLGAASVIVLEMVHPSGRAGGSWVVADFRADGTRVPASLRPPDGSDRDASARPAA